MIACGATDAAITSAFPTLDFANEDADQTPSAVAAAMPTKTTILRIVGVPSSVWKHLNLAENPPPACDRCHKMADFAEP